MSNDDIIYRFRVALFARAQEVGVSQACRDFNVHRSTSYRWLPAIRQWGLDALRPRERRPPQMPNHTLPWVEQRVIAFALGFPGLGPRRIAAELARERWGGIVLSPRGVYAVRKRVGLQTRARRLAAIVGTAIPVAPERPAAEEERHIEAKEPGDVVRLDCMAVGRLSGTKGRVWQYTAIDVASASTLVELHQTPHNPDARFTSALPERVARCLEAAGWTLRRVTTDNGSEFRAQQFRTTAHDLGAEHACITAGRPQSNGCVERVQRTKLEECWRPTCARALVPKLTTLRRDLAGYLRYDNEDRPNTGHFARGRTPADIVFGAYKMHRTGPVR